MDIFTFLKFQGQTPFAVDGGVEFVSPDGDHLIFLTHDGDIFLDGEDVPALGEDILADDEFVYWCSSLDVMDLPFEVRAAAFVAHYPSERRFLDALGVKWTEVRDGSGDLSHIERLR